MEAGEDWVTHKTDLMAKASRYFDAYVDKALPRSQWKNESNEFDYIIVRTVAQICAYFLISAHDPDSEDAIRIKEEYEDVLEKINAGHIKLGFEISADSSQGIIRELSASGTLKPIDLQGKYHGDKYDKLRVEIEVAGVIGTAQYSVWGLGNDKLGINKGQQIVSSQIINGSYQELANGLEIRFGASTPVKLGGGTEALLTSAAVEHDVWEVEVWSVGMEQDDSRSIKSINAVRT